MERARFSPILLCIAGLPACAGAPPKSAGELRPVAAASRPVSPASQPEEALPPETPAEREASRLEGLAEEHGTRDPELILALGVAKARAGDLEGAARQFRRVARLLPKDFRPPYNLGQVFCQMGRTREGIAAFEAALKLHPKQVDVLVDLGVAQRKEKDLQGSLAALRRATSLLSRSARAQLNLGLTLELLGQSGQAMEAYRRAVAADGKLRAAHLRLGVLLYQRKEYRLARPSLERAVALDGADADAQAALGTVLLQLREPGAAATHLARAAEKRSDGGLQMNLGLALERSGDVAAAAKAYLRATELLPSSGEAHLRLAIAQARSGQSVDAGRSAQKALRLDRTLRPALDPIVEELAKGTSLEPATALVDAILAVFPDDRVATHNRKALDQMRRRRATQ